MFDEALGALDRTLREGLLNELRAILHQTEIPAIYVTHDQEEAFAIADRILILQRGEITRDGKPAEVWVDPRSSFVAEFLGLGSMIDGSITEISDRGGSTHVQTEYGTFSVRCQHKHTIGAKVKLLIRPRLAEGEANAIQGIVSDAIFQQDRFKVIFDNGLYVYLNRAPTIGQQLSVPIKIECLA
jgi:ABC-type Fe3+/spermidine/putrescine transport system ATPase subunit